MARIVSKDMRIIDIDFGPVSAALTRTGGDVAPSSVNYTQNGVDQVISSINVGNGSGSYVQYSRIDLSFMTENSEIMQPVEASIQRTSPVPLGFNNNGNTYDQTEEYLFVFTRPLNNEAISALAFTGYEQFRSLGLDACEPVTIAGGAGSPSMEQCIYAEKRMYGSDTARMAIAGGALIPYDPLSPPTFNTIEGMPTLTSVSTWGTLGAITGPNLHCYRVIIDRRQTLLPVTDLVNLPLQGDSTWIWPPVNISFLCKDPNYTEGEYLTRVANVMGKLAEGGQSA